MPNINITVAAKIATNTTPGEVIVCGNSDYTVTFDFDSEWAAQAERTARFVYYKDGLSLYQDVAFTGNSVAVPVLSGISYVLVGVYAGSLHTTTPAKVLCDRSILCGDPLEVLTPEEKAKLQAQIDELREILDSGQNPTGGGLSTEAAALLVEILESAVYTGNMTGKIASLKEALASGGSGGNTGGGGSGTETPDEPDEPVADDITVADGVMTIITVGSAVSVSNGVMTIA